MLSAGHIHPGHRARAAPTAFSPDRGSYDIEDACDAALFRYGGAWGPWLPTTATEEARRDVARLRTEEADARTTYTQWAHRYEYVVRTGRNLSDYTQLLQNLPAAKATLQRVELALLEALRRQAALPENVQ